MAIHPRYVVYHMVFLRYFESLIILLYMNDLPKTSKLLKFFLFAVDTNIYFESDYATNLTRTIN